MRRSLMDEGRRAELAAACDWRDMDEHARYIVTTPGGVKHGIERTNDCCSSARPELGFATRPWTELLIDLARRRWSMRQHVGPWPLDVIAPGGRR